MLHNLNDILLVELAYCTVLIFIELLVSLLFVVKVN